MSNATRRGTLAALAGFLAVPARAAAAGSDDYPHAAAFAELLKAYKEDRECRSIDDVADHRSVEGRACILVIRRCWDLAAAFAALPPTGTPHDLGAKAIAVAILIEGNPIRDSDNEQQGVVHLVRAALAAARQALPQGHIGFADEPGWEERDFTTYACSGPGSLPAWAMEEARRQA